MSKPLRILTILGRPLAYPRPVRLLRPHQRSRHSLTAQNGTVKIQPVRFRKPNVGRRIRRLIFETSCFTLALGSVLWYFDLLEDIDEEDLKGDSKAATPHFHTAEELKEGENDEEGDHEVEVPETMPEDAIFIPLGFTRQRPQTFYKGSDPEWQSFLEFRRDRDREKAVRKELAVLVGNYFSGMRSMQKGLGKPIKVKHFWIDVIVPEGPPPEYERSGLEIADDYIAWTTRPVSSLQNARFQAALFPLPVAKSFWASFSTSLSLQYAKLRQYFNLGDGSGNSESSLSSGLTSLDQLQESSAKQETQTPTRMDKLSDPKSNEEGSTKGNSKHPSSESSKILSSLPPIPQVGNDNGAAITAFKQTLAKNWKPPSDFGERGTLLVTGLVQLDGPKGVCVLDIAAAYHPRESRYTHIACGIRNFRPRHQRPKGGP